MSKIQADGALVVTTVRLARLVLQYCREMVCLKRRRGAGGGTEALGEVLAVLGIAGRGKKGGVIWGAFGVRERLKDPEDETVLRMEVRGDLL